MAPIQGPTNASIPGHIKVPSAKPALIKTLSRLSRTSLINLALQWLENDTNPALHPYLESNRNLNEETEEDYLYTPAKNIEELRTTYEDLKNGKGTKREVIDRILDGDWRRGISLQQLAMVDFQHLQDTDTSLRWTALKLVALDNPENSNDTADDSSKPRKRRRLAQDSLRYPQIQPATFVSMLSAEISSLVKAHYHLHTISLTPTMTLPVLRLHLSSSPYRHTTPQASTIFLESLRTLYIALPPSCAYIYVALSGPNPSSTDTTPATTKTDIATLKRTVLSAIPKALSRPHERWSLSPTDLSAKSLRAICALRGSDRSGASGGAFSIFAEGEVDTSPLDPRFDGDEDLKENKIQTIKRKRKILAERDGNVNAAKVVEKVAKRFGGVGIGEEDIAKTENGNGPVQLLATREKTLLAPALDRVFVRIESNEPDAMEFNFTFGGTNVFAGLRHLAELGSVDAQKMPSWLSGEEGASSITVRDGVVINGRAGGA